MAGNLMIQGTMSGAGKSILTAGILRVLRQDGFRVAPFKSQNMALNSFVTRDGLEMGRAQVVQAAAAGMEPSADMNPILLKPMGDTTSQVIVNGKAIGKMRASDYYKVKKSLIPDIMAAYERLREQADIIVIEGAGSPVEINLREGDFVNMGLAEMVDAPVLIAGNIDPGGVFAQLLGTIQLLRPEERARVKGLIINKFRGDVGLLQPGLSMFGEYCDIPFAGVVPWIKLDLDEEDSMSEKLAGRVGRAGGASENRECVANHSAGDESANESAGEALPNDIVGKAATKSAGKALPNDIVGKAATGIEPLIDIAVIRLPYISNYTDFAPLERQLGVTVRYVANASSLGHPDLIILPGTKNTIGDLRWLRESGLENRIRQEIGTSRQEIGTSHCEETDVPSCRGTEPSICLGPEASFCQETESSLRQGTEPSLLMGICGGFQMLGRRILDPLGSETGGAEDGLGLLPVDTIFSADKYTRQQSGRTRNLPGVWAPLSGLDVSGYEIHMGRSEYLEDAACMGRNLPKGNGIEACSGKNLLESTGFAELIDSGLDGAVCGNVLGTYLHGIFDETPFRSALLDLLRKRKGDTAKVGTKKGGVSLAAGGAEAIYIPSGIESARQTQDKQLDLLADVLRKSLDWDLIYRAIGI